MPAIRLYLIFEFGDGQEGAERIFFLRFGILRLLLSGKSEAWRCGRVLVEPHVLGANILPHVRRVAPAFRGRRKEAFGGVWDSFACMSAYCATLGLPIPRGEDNWRLPKGASAENFWLYNMQTFA